MNRGGAGSGWEGGRGGAAAFTMLLGEAGRGRSKCFDCFCSLGTIFIPVVLVMLVLFAIV